MDIYTETEYDIIHDTSVDFVTRPVSKEVHIVQFDSDLPLIKVSLFKNNKKFALSQSAEAYLYVGKPDMNSAQKQAKGMSEDHTNLYFEVDNSIASTRGVSIAVVRIIINEKIAHSSPFIIRVLKNPRQQN